MTFVDSGQADPSQPLTLPQPQRDPRLQAPYTPHQPNAPQQSALPASVSIPYKPDRDADMWGKDHWPIVAATNYPGVMPSGSDFPSPVEAYSRLASSSSQLQRWGSDDVAERAGRVNQLAMGFAPLLDMLSRGAFSKGFNASSLASIKRQQEQLILESEQMQQEHARQLVDYGGIFARADGLAKQDPAHAAQIYEDAKEELRDAAISHRDGPLMALLDTRGGIETARAFIKQQDATFRDAWAANTALKKATGVDEDVKTAAEWGEPPPKTARGGGIFEPRVPPGETAGGGPQAPQLPTGSDFNSTMARDLQLTPQERQAVNEEVASGKPSAGIEGLKGGKQTSQKDDIRQKVGLGVQATNGEINRIADDNSLTPEQKLAAIGRINSGVASDIARLSDYRLNPREEGVVNRQRLAQLTGKIFKDYNQQNFTNANKFYDTGSVENKVITRSNDLVQNWMTLLKSLKLIGENKSIPREVIEAWIAGHGTGDPEYDTVYSQIRNIATQINAIQTLTGTPRVTLVHDIVQNLQKDSSPRSIRAQLLPDIQDAYAIVNSYQDQWEGFGKKSLMPAITPDVFRDYRAIVRMNPYTGQVPDDAGLELKAASNDPSRASSRLSDEQKWEPLTLDRIRKLKGMISQYDHDPDPDKRQQAQEARERIGPVRNIDRRIPGVDEDTNAARP